MRFPRKFLILPLLVAGVLAAAVTPAALAAPAGPAVAADDPAEHVVACDGGAQRRALVRLNDTPTPLAEDPNNTFAPLPGAAVQFVIPANQNAQIIAIFTAESVLDGQPLSYVVPADALRIRILLDGAPMPPADNVIFTTDIGQSNAAQACKHVGDGNHTVRVEWWLDDVNMNSVLTGTLNKWVLHVEVNAP